jgi:hypothetical protein
VEAHGELRGEKQFGLNHLWTCPQSRGHIKLIEKGHIMKRSQCSLDINWEAPYLLGDWSPPMIT